MSATTILPRGDLVVAQPIEAESKTVSGLLLTDRSQERAQVAHVLAVGPDVSEVKVGDKIVFGGEPESFGDLLLVREDDCLATVKP